MARFLRSTRTRTTPSRALPLMLLGQAAMVLRDHWRTISPADRSRLAELLKASKGRPVNLTPQQRGELSGILKRANIGGLGRDLAPLATKRAMRGRRPLRRG